MSTSDSTGGNEPSASRPGATPQFPKYPDEARAAKRESRWGRASTATTGSIPVVPGPGTRPAGADSGAPTAPIAAVGSPASAAAGVGSGAGSSAPVMPASGAVRTPGIVTATAPATASASAPTAPSVPVSTGAGSGPAGAPTEALPRTEAGGIPSSNGPGTSANAAAGADSAAAGARPAAAGTVVRRPATERPASRPAATRPGGGRRVRLTLSRVDPWSALKMSFLLSVAIGIAMVVAVATLWMILNSMGVFTEVNALAGRIIQDGGQQFDILDYVGFTRVVSLAIVIAVIDVFLWTAVATLGSFIYNVSSSLVGGLQLTLTDD